MPNRTDNIGRRTMLKLVGTGSLAAASGCIGLSGSGSSDTNGSNATGSNTNSSGTSSNDTIVFGQPASLTGQWDFLQPGISQATDAAVQKINEAGGPLGSELEVVRRDTAVNPQQARTVVTQLIQNDNAAAYLQERR